MGLGLSYFTYVSLLLARVGKDCIEAWVSTDFRKFKRYTVSYLDRLCAAYINRPTHKSRTPMASVPTFNSNCFA
jgi:hypothetical protein